MPPLSSLRTTLPCSDNKNRCPLLELPECLFFCLPSDVLRFDNTYSFIHAKKVSFTVEVLLPDKASEEKMKQLGAVTPK